MAVLVRIALPAIVVLSALGAALMCVLVVRYGVGLGDEDDVDGAEHRGVVMRLGHAIAGVCFACVAMLAVVTAVARPPAPPASEVARAAAKSEEPEASAPTAAGDEALLRLEQRLSTEIAQLEERVSAAEAAARAAGARAETATQEAKRQDAKPEEAKRQEAKPEEAKRQEAKPEEAAALPPRAPETVARVQTPPRRRAETAPRASRAVPPENSSAALPADIGQPKLSATVEGVRLAVHARASISGRDAVYTIRLSDAANRPVTGADVTMLSETAAGAPVRAVLEPSGEPGVYRGRVPGSADAPGLRLRVVHRDKRFEVSLDHGVSW